MGVTVGEGDVLGLLVAVGKERLGEFLVGASAGGCGGDQRRFTSRTMCWRRMSRMEGGGVRVRHLLDCHERGDVMIVGAH